MKNEINNEELVNVNGGTSYHKDPYGYLCEGTVTSMISRQNTINGFSVDLYKVIADNGKEYECIWNKPYIIEPVTKVRIMHNASGPFMNRYTIELI